MPILELVPAKMLTDHFILYSQALLNVFHSFIQLILGTSLGPYEKHWGISDGKNEPRPCSRRFSLVVGTKQCTDHYGNKPITCQLWVCACLFSKLFSAVPLICCISSTLWLSGQFSRQKAPGKTGGWEEGKSHELLLPHHISSGQPWLWL